jgi:hypothetical protein
LIPVWVDDSQPFSASSKNFSAVLFLFDVGDNGQGRERERTVKDGNEERKQNRTTRGADHRENEGGAQGSGGK